MNTALNLIYISKRRPEDWRKIPPVFRVGWLEKLSGRSRLVERVYRFAQRKYILYAWKRKKKLIGLEWNAKLEHSDSEALLWWNTTGIKARRENIDMMMNWLDRRPAFESKTRERMAAIDWPGLL